MIALWLWTLEKVFLRVRTSEGGQPLFERVPSWLLKGTQDEGTFRRRPRQSSKTLAVPVTLFLK